MKFLRLLPFIPLALAAETIRVTPETDWFSRISGEGLKPGDELVLAAGVYSDPRRLEISHRGTSREPVVIRGEEGAILRRPDAKQNSINIVGAQYLVVRDLEITGGSAGVRIYASEGHPAKAIAIIGLHIHHVGGAAVTCNHEGNTYEGMVFKNNHIHHTGGHGEAFYLGCNNREDGTTPGLICNSLIEGNYIHHLDGDGISQGDGIELKDGSWGNFVRRNVIHDTKYPGITVYGTDGKDSNSISSNLIWNTSDHGIQVAGEATVFGNIIVSPGQDGIRSKPHQSAVPKDLTIENNTVIGGKGGSCVRIDVAKGGSATLKGNKLVPAAGQETVRVPDGRSEVTVEGGGSDAPGAALFKREWCPAWKGEVPELLAGLVE